MLSRARWLGAGVAFGAAASLWTERKVKMAAAKYQPAGLAGIAVEKARGWPGQVRAAIEEGLTTMRQRETELRQELDRVSRP